MCFPVYSNACSKYHQDYEKKERKKDYLLLPNKLIKNIPNMHNEKEHYESFFSFFKNEKQKIWEKLEIITYKPKIFETVDIKSDIIEHPKTSHKFSNTIRKGKNPNNSLYSDTKKVQIF